MKKITLLLTTVLTLYFIKEPPVKGNAADDSLPVLLEDTQCVYQMMKEHTEYKDQVEKEIKSDLKKLNSKDVVTKPKTTVIKKTVVKNRYTDRKIIVKYGNRYFETTPQIDKDGSYIINLDSLTISKTRLEEQLNKPTKRKVKWYNPFTW